MVCLVCPASPLIGADDLESRQLRPLKNTQLAALEKGHPLLAQSTAGDLAITKP